MAMSLFRDVTDEEIQQFRRDGVVCLRGIVAPEWIEKGRAGAEELRAAPSPIATVREKDDQYVLIERMAVNHNENIRDIGFNSGIPDLVKKLMGSDDLHWLYDQLFYKGSGHVPETPWHQDTAYSCLQGQDIIRVWMPLDVVPRQTTI